MHRYIIALALAILIEGVLVAWLFSLVENLATHAPHALYYPPASIGGIDTEHRLELLEWHEAAGKCDSTYASDRLRTACLLRVCSPKATFFNVCGPLLMEQGAGS